MIPVFIVHAGIPLPPTGLQLKSSFNRELGTFQIRLIWMPTMTLFDNTNVNRQEPTYVVYAYITLNSSVRYLYRTETTFSSKNITLEDLNVTSACNLSTVFFHVSAKFEEVGEGNMSRPAELSGRDAKDICKTGKYSTYSIGLELRIMLLIEVHQCY